MSEFSTPAAGVHNPFKDHEFAIEAATRLPDLADWHRFEVLGNSRVALGIAARRGYKTIGTSEAMRLGYAPYQARPGMLIPLYSPSGEIWHQLKPYNPRTNWDRLRVLCAGRGRVGPERVRELDRLQA